MQTETTATILPFNAPANSSSYSDRYLAAGAPIVQGQRIERTGCGCSAYVVTEVHEGDRYDLANVEGESLSHTPGYILRSMPFRVLAEVAHADEVLFASTAAVAKRASDKRAREQAELARKVAGEKLIAAHPWFKVGEDRKTAAANMRIALKRAFPGVKFSVRMPTGSMVYSIDVRWTGGPTRDEVRECVGDFQSSTFDGMTDGYVSHHTAWNDVFGGCNGIFMTRE